MARGQDPEHKQISLWIMHQGSRELLVGCLKTYLHVVLLCSTLTQQSYDTLAPSSRAQCTKGMKLRMLLLDVLPLER